MKSGFFMRSKSAKEKAPHETPVACQIESDICLIFYNCGEFRFRMAQQLEHVKADPGMGNCKSLNLNYNC